MAKSPTTMFHELELTLLALSQQVKTLSEEVNRLREAMAEAVRDGASTKDLARMEAALGRLEAQMVATTERVARLEERTEQLRKDADPSALAVLRADFAEHKKRYETKEAWFRGLVASALVALLTSAVALVVALVRK